MLQPPVTTVSFWPPMALSHLSTPVHSFTSPLVFRIMMQGLHHLQQRFSRNNQVLHTIATARPHAVFVVGETFVRR